MDLAEPLVTQAIYLRKPNSEVVTCLTVALGIPEVLENGARTSVTLAGDSNSVTKHAFGVDRWQSLMLGISMLRLEVSHKFRDASFYYSEEDALQERDSIPLNEFFPQLF